MTKEDALYNLGITDDDIDLEIIISKTESKYNNAYNAEARNSVNSAAQFFLKDYPPNTLDNALLYLKLNKGQEALLKKILSKSQDTNYKCPELALQAVEATNFLIKKFRLQTSPGKRVEFSEPATGAQEEKIIVKDPEKSFFAKYKILLTALFSIASISALLILGYKWWYSDKVIGDEIETKVDTTYIDTEKIIVDPPTQILTDTTIIEYNDSNLASKKEKVCPVDFTDPEIHVKGSGKFVIREVTFYYKNIDGSDVYRYKARFTNPVSDNRDEKIGSTDFLDNLENGVTGFFYKNKDMLSGPCEFLQELSINSLSIYKITYSLSPVNDLHDEFFVTREY